jgi:predicted NBD/HSP70 family sugar kinase
VRQVNMQRVLEALRTSGPSSQAALARLTQLSPATVNNIAKALHAEGTVEIQPINGRESLVTLVSNHGAVVSIQVNVASVHGALFDFARGVRHDAAVEFEEGSDEEGGNPALVAEMVRSLAAQSGLAVQDLAGVAVGMQAPIARSSGMVASWARLQLRGWDDVVIGEALEEALGVPVIAENDANLAALAEWTWGVGRGCADFMYITCAVGTGGGIILDGKIYRGGDGMAGEIGHLVLEQNGPVCFCGSRGCLTMYVAERSILRALEASGGAHQSLEEVIDSARQGDAACQRVLHDAGRYLGRALANTAKVLAPSVIAIGGTLGDAGPLLFDSLQSSVEVNSLKAVSPTIRFVPAQIKRHATIYGGVAAVLARVGQGVSAPPEWMTR